MRITVSFCLMAISALVSAMPTNDIAFPVKASDLEKRTEVESGVLRPVKLSDLKTRSQLEAEEFDARDKDIMHPIRARDFDAMQGIYKRELPTEKALELHEDAEMIFGKMQDSRQVFAKFKMTPKDNSKIISMEDFEGHTSQIDCQGADGEMSITFTSQTALAMAQKGWAVINEAADKHFFLIANHDGCGPANERQLYRIDEVKVASDSLKAVLASKPVEWKDVIGDFSVDVGEAQEHLEDDDSMDAEDLPPLPTPASSAMPSGITAAPVARRTAAPEPFFDKIKNKIKDGADKVKDVGKKVTSAVDKGKDVVTSAVDKGKDVATKVAVDKGKQVTSVAGQGASKVKQVATDAAKLIKDLAKKNDWEIKIDKTAKDKDLINTGPLKLTCKGCMFKGVFKFHTRIEHKGGKFEKFEVEASAKDMKAKMALDTKIDLTGLGPIPLKTFKTNIIPSTGIPVLTIPKLFAIGPTVRLEAGGSLKAMGYVDATFGFETTVPDKTGVTLNYKELKKSKAYGWNKVTTKPIFTVREAAAQFDLTAWITPIVAIEISAGDGALFRVAADIQFDLPRIKLQATPGKSEEGWCPGKDEKAGVNFKADLILYLDAGLTGELLNTDIAVLTGNAGFGRKRLYNYTKNLKDICIPLGKSKITNEALDEANEEASKTNVAKAKFRRRNTPLRV